MFRACPERLGRETALESSVRIVPLLLWLVGSIMWLPWLVLLLRLLIDLALGVPLSDSRFLNPALVGFWPVLGWRHWQLVSWWPLLALLAVALSAWAWRLKAHMEDHLLYASGLGRLASTLIPPLALWLAYLEARQNRTVSNELLDEAVSEASSRLGLH